MNQSVASTKLDVQNITITKIVDIATVALAQYCALGKHIPKGQITCRKNAGDRKVEYLRIELHDIMVKDIDWQDKGEKAATTELVQLNFAEFKIHYALQNNRGNEVSTTEFGFNVVTHQQTSGITRTGIHRDAAKAACPKSQRVSAWLFGPDASGHDAWTHCI